MEKKIKKIIQQYQLIHRTDVIRFIKTNPENLGIDELSRISELVNNSRVDTAAYYTDKETLVSISSYLPELSSDEIHVLEPSVGVGNFLQIIIEKYSDCKKLVIDVNDIDAESIEVTRLLNSYRKIPENVTINYSVGDFLTQNIDKRYDLVIGNPPFLRLSRKSSQLIEYCELFLDDITTNISGFFLQKAAKISKNIVMIMPKYFLSNTDFTETRKRIEDFSIDYILDFGEKGFKGVLIETIALFINTEKPGTETVVYSITKNIMNKLPQDKMTSSEFPTWLLYRNDFFDQIASKMQFDIFKVFRDRQLTNSVLQERGDIQVLKSRNIKRDGTGIISLDNYDVFISSRDVRSYTVSKYLNRDDVFLTPNMTYYPRVIRKPKKTLVNGSVAILEKKLDVEITDKHLKFLSEKVFEKFYSIARNYSTRSLNIDASSVFYFGLYDSNK